MNLKTIGALILSSTLLLSSCSVFKKTFGGKDKKEPSATLQIEDSSNLSGQQSNQSDGNTEMTDLPAEAIEEDSLTIKLEVPEIPVLRPEITFSEAETAHVGTTRNNNPFPESGELVLDLDKLKAEFYYPYNGKYLRGFSLSGRRHTGVDIKAIPRDTIRAAWPGVVRMSKLYSGYGNVVVIRHYNGIETVYSHQCKNLVRPNDVVEAGDPIGLAGRTGRATTEHLHFEIRIAGTPINPALFIDTENHQMKTGQTIYCYNRGGRITASTRQSVGYTPEEEPEEKPTVATTTRQSSAPTSSSSVQYHYVKKGETLSHIAVKYSTTVSKLCALNGIKKTSILQINQKLRVK